jgi:DNA-binding transcriptional ArsR family regulator
MTFHDKNRILAHLAQPLPSGTKAVLLFVADALNAKTGTIQFSCSHIARQLGVKSRKTIEKHLAILENLGLLVSSRKGERSARIWQLGEGVVCPQGCKHIKTHNTASRLKRLEQSKVVDNPDQMSNSCDQMSKYLPTNRTKEIDIDIDKRIQFSKSEVAEFITGVISQLTELKPDHNTLLGYLETHKAEVESKALAILEDKKANNLGGYLFKVVTNTPAELFRQLITKPQATTKPKASSKSVATIHTTATTARVTFGRLKGYASKQLGFEITEATKLYLLDKIKLGLSIGHKDLIICMEVERHNKQLRDEQLNTNSELELSCRNGLPSLSWTGENHNWNFYTDEFLEANGRPHYKEGYKLAQAHIEQLNKQLVSLYELMPANPNLEAYDLDLWLISNYGIDEDYQEFLEAYPTKPEGISWNAEKAKAALLSAQQRGYSYDQLKALASALPRNSANWANHKQHPHTWLDSLPAKEQARADKEQIDSVTASNLSDLVQSFTKP